jgi:predicted SprT family Zn-dependent metalloprotease
MDIAKLTRIAEQLLRDHRLDGWEFRLDTKMRRLLGRCDYRHRLVAVNAYYAAHNGDDLVLDTLRHEAAHALTPGHGHDEVWRMAALQLGCAPRACWKEDVILPPGRYRATCHGCGRCYHRDRIRRGYGYHCMPCGVVTGALTFCRADEAEGHAQRTGVPV